MLEALYDLSAKDSGKDEGASRRNAVEERAAWAGYAGGLPPKSVPEFQNLRTEVAELRMDRNVLERFVARCITEPHAMNAVPLRAAYGLERRRYPRGDLLRCRY